MNKQLQKVISGLEHHSGLADWRCWKDDNEDILSKEYCPYFEENSCVEKLMIDALNLFKEYDIALRMMVYQYCTIDKSFLEGKERIIRNPDQEVFFHRFMSAGETAFKVLGIDNEQEVPEDFI